jgi:hypothetical protein
MSEIVTCKVKGKALADAQALAELIGAPPSVQYRWSCYNGVELWWFDDESKPMCIVTYVDGIHAFAYTKDKTGLLGDWQKLDYWFLYL